MERKDLPMGFTMMLAENEKAMKKFAGLCDEKRKEIIDGTHNIKTKEEMRRYVNEISVKY